MTTKKDVLKLMESYRNETCTDEYCHGYHAPEELAYFGDDCQCEQIEGIKKLVSKLTDYDTGEEPDTEKLTMGVNGITDKLDKLIKGLK